MLTIIQINLFITSRIFKNSFQELCIHFIMANAQKNYWACSNTTGSPECRGRRLSDSVLSNWQKRAPVSIHQPKGGLLLKGQLQLFVDESAANQQTEGKAGSRNLPQEYTAWTNSLRKPSLGEKHDRCSSQPHSKVPPSDRWLTSACWPDWGQPVSTRLSERVRLLFSQMRNQGLPLASLIKSGPTMNIWLGQTLKASGKGDALNLPKYPLLPTVFHWAAHTYTTCPPPESICAQVSRMDWGPLTSLPDSRFYKETGGCFNYLYSTETGKGLGWILKSFSHKESITLQPRKFPWWGTSLGFIKQGILGSERLK